MRAPLSLGTLLLLALAACQKPATLPASPASRAEAAAQAGALAFPASGRADYVRGFANGARMIDTALALGQRPYLPRVAPARPLTLEVHPGGAAPQAVAPPPEVEVDPATGLILQTFYSQGLDTFAQGQVDGFQWALAPHRARLTEARPAPALPTTWKSLRPETPLTLATGQTFIQCQASRGLLAWSIQDQGFPPRRRWRPLPAGLAPHHASLAGDTLWIDTPQGALGLDLDSGAIRQVLPTQPHPANAEDTWEATLLRKREEDARARPELLKRADQGDMAAILALGYAADDNAEKVRWFKQAATAGDPQGMYEWALLLYQGRGVPEDPAAARTWLQKAAAQGHRAAGILLGGLFPP
ncbi:tetratricopeptide repeat protein [Mesoterricola sediminis]|uniref:Sel1 repeat family protein n=1 Tax=Mesoterricola sediminis TaxID=2927980 RepID=A0AA48GX97_9BACT|nr:hypothetical protein [Mesoterricola sediminis]BDU77969.1 hypothetical protein METESE_29270 [Mesoterricola sediminis]